MMEGIDELFDLLNDSHHGVRKATVYTVGEYIKNLKKILIETSCKDEDEEVRNAALKTLNLIGG